MRWTDEEREIVRRECTKGPGWVQRVHAQLPHRTPHAIRIQGCKGIERVRPWFPPREKGCLRPGLASLAHARRH